MLINIININLLADENGNELEKRGCVGVFQNYTFCSNFYKTYPKSKLLYCIECSKNECNRGYKYPNKATTIIGLNKYACLLIIFSLHKIIQTV